MIQIKAVSNKKLIEQTASLADSIWRECYASLLPRGQIDYMIKEFQSADAIERDITQKGYTYFIILCDGAECGYIATAEEDSELFLSKLYLSAFARGKGLGRQAMDYVAQQARTLGKKSVRLTVNVGNERAIKRYGQYGFDAYDHTVTDIGGGYVMDDLLMRMAV